MSDPSGMPSIEGVPMAKIAGRGAVFTMGAQAVVLATTLVGTVVLANLLSPSSFGLVGMVTAATGVGDLLRDAGLGNASIQARTLSHQQRSNLFWASTGLGLVVSALAFFAAPLVALLYSNPAITSITEAIAISFLLNGLAAQHRASLSRALRLRTAAFIDAFSAVFSTTTGIVLAAVTHSVWALVAQQLAGPAAALVLAFASARWLPLLPRREPGFRQLVSYGLHQLGAQVAVYIGENIDTLIAGYRFSASEVGYYSRAYSLVTRPLTQVNVPASKLATPVLSRLQDDDERFNRYLIRAQRMVLLVAGTVLMLCASVVAPIVSVLLGDRWLPTAPLIQILAAGALFRVAAFSTSWVASSRGFNKVSLYANLCALPVTIVGIAVGSIWGIIGIAVGQAISGLALWIMGLIWFAFVAGMPSRKLAGSALRSIAALVLPFAGGYAVSEWLWGANHWLTLVSGGAAFVGLFAMEVLLVRSVRDDVALVTALAPVAGRGRRANV